MLYASTRKTYRSDHSRLVSCDIYRKASRTVIWLGEEAQNSSLGIELCERLYEFFKDEREDRQRPKMEFNFRTLWLPNDKNPFNPEYAQTDEGDFKKRAKRETTKGDEKEGSSVEKRDTSLASEDLQGPDNMNEITKDKSCVAEHQTLHGMNDKSENNAGGSIEDPPLRMNPPNVYELLAL